MILEEAVLTLECDAPDHDPLAAHRAAQFRGKTIAVAYRAAREAGWAIYLQQGKAKCHACRAAGKGLLHGRRGVA